VLEPLGFRQNQIVPLPSILLVSAALMLPVSVLSGALFTLLGAALETELGEQSRAAGALTLANTLGAALGALAVGLALLPWLGVERAFFVLALLYAAVALCVGASRASALALPRGSGVRKATWAMAGLYVVFVAVFPFGLMRHYYVKAVTSRWLVPGTSVVASREGVSETVFYMRTEVWGSPVYHRLVTNGYSMSATGIYGERYMSLFAYLATALRPDARRALLISYGLGETAKALTRSRGLEAIEVVDISPDILELGRVVFPPGEFPLDDPRVRVHVEDGRFFLLTTRERFDIITGEPPPPKAAGVVSLYTRDYFQLARARLADRGVITYWLPVYQMEPGEARSLTRAFCDVFEDCSLWAGSGLEWLLVGSRGLSGPLSEQALWAPFRDPEMGPALARIGLEHPGQLGALFVADADDLRQWTAGAAPLDDQHPFRLSYRFRAGDADNGEYAALMDASVTRRRFERSRYIAGLWPQALRDSALEAFGSEAIVSGWLLRAYTRVSRPTLPDLAALLAQTRLRAPVLWLMGSSDARLEAALGAWREGGRDPQLEEAQGVAAMAERDYARAEAHFARAQPGSPRAGTLLRWRVLALLLAGDRPRALGLLGTDAARPGEWADGREEWEWLAARASP
jgi:spermidine synthase